MLQRVAKEGFWVVSGNVLHVFGMLFLLKQLTSYMEPSEFGVLALTLVVAGLINQLIFGGFVQGLIRFYSVANLSDQINQYIDTYFLTLAIATMISILLSFVIAFGMTTFSFEVPLLLIIGASLHGIFTSINNASTGLHNAIRKRARAALFRGAESWLKVLLVMWLALSGSVTVSNVLLAYTSALLALVLMQLVSLRGIFLESHGFPFRIGSMSSLGEVPKSKLFQDVLAFSLPFSIWGLFTWSQQASDRWSLEFFQSTSEVGIYAAAFQLGYGPIQLGVSMLITLLAPILYAEAGDALDSQKLNDVWLRLIRITTYLSIFLFGAWLIAIYLHDFIFEILVDDAYQEGSALFPYLIVAGGLFSISQLLTVQVHSALKTKDVIRYKIVISLIGAIINFLGALMFGVWGVVLGMCIFGCIAITWALRLARAFSV